MIHTESEKRCKYICVMLCACDYSEKAISPITWWGPHYIHCTVPLASSSLRPSANTIFPPRPSAITELRGHSLAEWRNLPVVRPRRRERGSQFSSPFRPVIWNVYRIIASNTRSFLVVILDDHCIFQPIIQGLCLLLLWWIVTCRGTFTKNEN